MKSTYLDEVLVPALKADPGIKSYQLNATSSHTLKGGFINDQFGGVYRPVINSSVERVSFMVLLKDGRSSTGSSQLGIKPEALIKKIYASAHHSDHPIVFAPKPEGLEPVKLTDDKIRSIVEDNPEAISRITSELQTAQLKYGHELIEGGVKLVVASTRLVSSEGVDMKSTSTRQSMHTYYEDRVGVGLSERNLFEPNKLSQNSNSMSDYVKQLDGKPANLKSGKYPVLLEPMSSWGLLDKFVLENVRGKAVEAGQSRFSIEDFQKSQAIAHSSFNLAYDQRKPMSTESFNFSSQGVPSQAFTLIGNGKLTEPICDLKTAKALGYKAKALDTLYSTDAEQDRYDDFAGKNPTFILVFNVMGIHTSKSMLGNYSLPAPDSLLIQNGDVVGPINCILSGNFFDVLKQPSTGFVNASHAFDGPALTFETQVTVK